MLGPTKEIHVSTAQRYAAAAFQDGLEEDTIKSIASLATWGKHMQNAERDLHRWLPHAYNSGLEPFTTVIEVWNPDQARVEQRSIPILLASDVLSSIWKKQSNLLWDACIGATPAKCKLYWDLAKDEWASQHPVVQLFGRTMVYKFCFLFLFVATAALVQNTQRWEFQLVSPKFPTGLSGKALRQKTTITAWSLRLWFGIFITDQKNKC